MERAYESFWPQNKIDEQFAELEPIRSMVTISGGFAWHLMSVPHEERKAFHDHKDVDLFVDPPRFHELVQTLKGRGFDRVWTKYDGITPNFYRYTKYGAHKTMLDVFVSEIASITVDNYQVVEPSALLKLYETSHSSKECVAVKAATALLAKGISPIGRPELTAF